MGLILSCQSATARIYLIAKTEAPPTERQGYNTKFVQNHWLGHSRNTTSRIRGMESMPEAGHGETVIGFQPKYEMTKKETVRRRINLGR